jgi:hypothetical protein
MSKIAKFGEKTQGILGVNPSKSCCNAIFSNNLSQRHFLGKSLSKYFPCKVKTQDNTSLYVELIS